MLNLSDANRAHAAERLRSESVVWLTTVSPDGVPQPTPVWFVWEGGDEITIYTPPQSLKVRNIRNNDRVAVNFNSDERGADVVVFLGRATLDDSAPAVKDNPAYAEKYRRGMQSIGLTPESMSQIYSQPIRVKFSHIRVQGV